MLIKIINYYLLIINYFFITLKTKYCKCMVMRCAALFCIGMVELGGVLPRFAAVWRSLEVCSIGVVSPSIALYRIGIAV